ncbi:MAG: RtcB family protein [Actinomycetota bacterium]|nr:RtcB family protein [Actinomycetota bacterium]
MERITDKLCNWASVLDPKTRAQACETAQMPFIAPHLALMPDAHLGLGATVGSVIPTVGAIMPAAVGVDIGCGMHAVRTQFTLADVQATDNDLHALHKAIASAVPLSAGNYNAKVSAGANARIEQLESLAGIEQAQDISPNWRMQLGSLGSGNHFIEVSLDENDDVWLFLHSGSRGVGNKLAQKHIKVAEQVSAGGPTRLPNRDLAYLTEGTVEFDSYIEALRWAQTFALLNRDEMMDRVVACTATFMGVPVKQMETVACHHNYTEQETHFGQQVWLSRKGAINAEEGCAGLIPGSMGDRSYVVVGKGNEMALRSAPHGAGRNHSRSAAKKLSTREDLNSRMAGVAWGESDAFLDEHPDAYKPIDVVMGDAADLVAIRHELRQIVNVKGG